MVDPNSVIVQEFLIESFENLTGISEELTQYEKTPTDSELLNSIYRKVHTLKGSASFLGLHKLQEITHEGENLLDLIREGEVQLTGDHVDLLLETFDACIEILKSIEESGHEPEKSYEDILKKYSSSQDVELPQIDDYFPYENYIGDKKLSPLPIKAEAPVVATPKEEKPVQKVVEKKVEPVKEVLPAEKPKEVKISKPQIKNEKKMTDEKTVEQPTAARQGNISDSVVRVNVKLLDKIMNVVGELVLNRNQILQFANNEDAPELNRLAQELNVITTELQTDIMTTRMQPVGSVLGKFERIVRDLARSQKKKIKLTITGRETELDKTLLEAIRDPMTHLIRNSVDHGVETPDARNIAGKNEEGSILIKAYHEGGQVTIEIKDDGNGIDPEKILEKALNKGLITPERASQMGKKDILNLIFLPGFSTAEQVTNISGRGVGMDVVRSNIEKIGGSVDIDSKVGEGTSFKLKIPLTLAIVPALVVQSGIETFAIPQINLVELVRLEGDECKTQIEKLHESEFYRLRGDLIPVFRLSESIGLRKNCIKEREKYEEDFLNIVILNAEGKVYGLIVDTVLDTEEIVVKALSRKLKDLSIYGGTTIMGDGKVALIVDALGFLNYVDKGHSQKASQMVVQESVNTLKNETDEVLLCRLGDDRHYSIPLCLVNRLEEFEKNQIEWSGDQPLIRYRNKPMPLINLEKTMKLNGTSNLMDKDKGMLPCVVVSIRNSLFGFIVSEIRDIALNDDVIDSDTVDRDGILGTIYVNETTVSLIDCHKIIDMQPIGQNLKKKTEQKSRGKILLVEDSVLYKKIQKEHLSDLGFEIVEANHGQEAIEILKSRRHQFDIIVTDLEMPVCNGWEFVKFVKEHVADFGDIPVIAMSGTIKSKDLDEGLRSGFKMMIEKLNQQAFQEAINNVMTL